MSHSIKKVKELKEFIRCQEARVAEARAQIEEFQSIPQENQLAEMFHDYFCNLASDFACMWHEEDFSDDEHQMYLLRAKKALEVSDFDSIVKIFDIANTLY